MKHHATAFAVCGICLVGCGSSASPTEQAAGGVAGVAVAGGGVGGHLATGGSSGHSSGDGTGGSTSGGTGGSTSGGGASTGGGAAGATNQGDGNFLISAPFSPAAELTLQAGVPRGTIHDFTMSSSESAIYPTDFATHAPFTRNVSVYVPTLYVTGTAAPFIVVQDGISFYRSTMVPVLDNMIHSRRLPVLIAIFVEPGPNEGTPTGERSFEYDSVSDAYVKFVETELLPKVQGDYALKLTTNPNGRAAMGGSSGGAAAFTMGWFRPDLYHRILTYSGSFCDLQPSLAYPRGAWEYHESLIANNPAKPLRVALEVGENDGNWNTATDTDRNWKTANLAMAAALAAKGYHYRFVYAIGASHMDSGVLQQTLPETLEWLWQGYPIP